ncbi:hypothetical protein IVA80_25805 [Bradyrhizobium sp. 139]|uniref:hypothetical protein n=1 Tax=Bradyrhizobium sp. 139 TaxID=2782616 RepID=UPI001FFA01CB|nr:hypothetical protein [Bradyrhizobium sp. 139]MCK1744158.1 hypothetical protein [Bradyrhizobium sp. 139]
MNIAVLGWGSVVWNAGSLHLEGRFQCDGPALPIEFCRVSRDGRLTLVIDQRVGTPCKTYSAKSAFVDIHQAVSDLVAREKTPGPARIGFVDLIRDIGNEDVKARQPRTFQMICEWMREKGFDGAVWTALPAKFKPITNRAFSVQAGLQYLEGLAPDKLSLALNYIRMAPPEVLTPFREAVNRNWPAERVQGN